MKNQSPNTDKTLMGSAIVVAFVASLCCITPVAASLAGIGGIASTFSWMEPVRPYLIGLSLLILGFAWYQKLKPKSDHEIDCECEENPSFWKSKGFLGIVTVLGAVLMTFPYYSEVFFPEKPSEIVYVQQSNVQSITFDIAGMTCTGCEATVKNAANGVDGVLEIEASYVTGKATVTFDRTKTKQKEIEDAINKTGFTAKEEPSTNPTSKL